MEHVSSHWQRFGKQLADFARENGLAPATATDQEAVVLLNDSPPGEIQKAFGHWTSNKHARLRLVQGGRK